VFESTFYDDKDLDALHISRFLKIAPSNNIHLVALPFAGHPSSHYLNELGVIKDLPVKVGSENTLEGLDFFSKRLTSPSYLYGLSRHMLKTNKLRSSLLTIDAAIKINPKFAEFYRHKSEIMERLDKLQQCVECMREAIKLEPDNPNFQNRLRNILVRQKIQ
jgi:tetratricopeptide (TPR) repeat protein